MRVKIFTKKLFFYLGLSIFVAILKINYLIGILGGTLYIFAWHFIFDRKQKEAKELSNYELSKDSSQIKSKKTEQNDKQQRVDTSFFKSVDIISIISLILILASIGFFIYACSKYYSSPSAEAVGELIGIVVLSLIVVLIIGKLIKRKELALLIFALAFTVIAGFNSYDKLQESKIINRSIQAVLNPSSESYSKKEYGEFAPFLIILRNYQKQMNDLSETMKNEIGSQSIDDVLSQQTLSNSHNIQNALLRLSNVQKSIDKYKMLYKNKMNELKEEISKVDASPDLKQSSIRGYTKGFRESTRIMDQIFDTEKDSMITTKKLLNFLLERQGKYEFQNGQIAFYEDSDINQYNNFISKINSLAQKEQNLFISYQQKFEEARDKIKKDLVK